MKLIVNTARILVGALFIFSGLVKAIDPLGLSYKMQEFFEVWKTSGYLPGLMDKLNGFSLSFSIIMITLEVLAGLALLLGFKKKLTAWLLLLLMIFFTFLTSYVLFSGKIEACGCFGDCIPLTPTQTFTKDIILLVLVLIVLFGNKHINPLFKDKINWGVMIAALAAVLFLQWYVLKHLPLADCLPYKKGNNILELRKMPKDAIPDKFDYSFVYEKNGEKKDFDTKHLPDSTWKFVERKQVLIEKGKNNKPVINDFSLNTISGNDSTEAILGEANSYYLFFIKDMKDIASWQQRWYSWKAMPKIPVYIITSNREAVSKVLYNGQPLFNDQMIFTLDATALKTAARADAVLYLMEGPVIKNKWAVADLMDAGGN